jgi:hydrogenase-4 component B
MVIHALFGVLVLMALALVVIALGTSSRATAVLYGASLAVTLALAIIALLGLLGYGGDVSTITLPLGLPWLGAHFRLDAL